MSEWLIELLGDMGMSPGSAQLLTDLIEVLLVACAAILAYHLTNQVLLRIVGHVTSATRTDWDDRVVSRGVFRIFSHLIPAFVIFVMAPVAFASPMLIQWAQRGSGVYAVLAALTGISLLLSVANEIYDEFEIARRFPIRVYVQVMKILLSAGALMICVSILTGQSPLLLLSGLGAMTAVLLLISKDSIQGLLAGIQLISNDMVRTGDWIEMPQYGADGDVMDITLHTVKVRNFDNTITTIPTYALISHSFKNWRGMSESGGRRIKRSLLIDVSSVRFCTEEMLSRYREIDLARGFLPGAPTGDEPGRTDSRSGVHGDQLTNLGVFRYYVVAYLRAHPQINKELTLLVRQLQPTEHGIPLELYTFSADKRWANYEDIQSEIFDHLFARIPQFDLRAFQVPSGQDAVTAIQGLQSRT